MVHTRRLLDIVACTTSFGSTSSSPKTPGRPSSKEPGSKEKPDSIDITESGSDINEIGKAGEKGDAAAAAAAAVSLSPPPRLGQFYDFFSFSQLTPPIQCIALSFSFVLIDQVNE